MSTTVSFYTQVCLHCTLLDDLPSTTMILAFQSNVKITIDYCHVNFVMTVPEQQALNSTTLHVEGMLGLFFFPRFFALFNGALIAESHYMTTLFVRML